VGTDRALLGAKGEQLAEKHLAEMGYTILERNYRRLPAGEIDIVARESGDLVFVEVKTRRSERFGAAAESVGREKRRRLTRAAMCYISEHNLGEVSCRFDVAEVYMKNGAPVTVEVIQGAFFAEE
jgi:putative endonuclease